MKKFLTYMILSILLTCTNVMAWDLTSASVDNIKITADGTVVLTITDGSSNQSTRIVNMNDADVTKMVLATAMTALSGGFTVDLWIADSEITDITLNK